MTAVPTKDDLLAASCWEADDRVPGRPEMTAFRRAARYQQARWRADHGHPIGTQPYVPKPGKPVRPVGSRIPLDYGRTSGANFLTAAALDAARTRTSFTEPHQSVDHQRLWADLLSSEALAFNLFGDLAADHALASTVLRTWLPELRGSVSEVRFAHSPGRLDPAYLNSLRAFDVAFAIDHDDGTRGVVGVAVRYHEWMKPATPRPENRDRYLEVAARSGCFRPGASRVLVERGDLWALWLEHLLLFSMLQHPRGAWTWGRYVVIHPAANVDVADALTRYRAHLTDDSTLVALTLDELLDSGLLPAATTTAARDRYLLP